MAKAPNHNSLFRYLEQPELTPLLTTLVGEAALPLRAVESAFATDSTGFSTCTLARVLRAAPQTIARAGTGKAEVSASLAFRVARVAAVSISDVVSGVYPPDGACPQCGYAMDDLGAVPS